MSRNARCDFGPAALREKHRHCWKLCWHPVHGDFCVLKSWCWAVTSIPTKIHIRKTLSPWCSQSTWRSWWCWAVPAWRCREQIAHGKHWEPSATQSELFLRGSTEFPCCHDNLTVSSTRCWNTCVHLEAWAQIFGHRITEQGYGLVWKGPRRPSGPTHLLKHGQDHVQILCPTQSQTMSPSSKFNMKAQGMREKRGEGCSAPDRVAVAWRKCFQVPVSRSGISTIMPVLVVKKFFPEDFPSWCEDHWTLGLLCV